MSTRFAEFLEETFTDSHKLSDFLDKCFAIWASYIAPRVKATNLSWREMLDLYCSISDSELSSEIEQELNWFYQDPDYLGFNYDPCDLYPIDLEVNFIPVGTDIIERLNNFTERNYGKEVL